MVPAGAGDAELAEVVQETGLTALLLDVSHLALCSWTTPDLSDAISAQPSGPGQLQAALSALQAGLMLNDSAPPLSVETCCDLMMLFIYVSQVSNTGVSLHSPLCSLDASCFARLFLGHTLHRAPDHSKGVSLHPSAMCCGYKQKHALTSCTVHGKAAQQHIAPDVRVQRH